MHDLNHLLAECKQELDALKIPYGIISEICVNTTAKKRYGQCRLLPDKTFSIQISELLLADSISKQAVKHTIIHELLHSVPGCMNHKAKWVKMATKVNKAYGYQIRRISSLEERGISSEEILLPSAKPKYQLQCVNCSHTFNYYRWCETLAHYKNYHCTRCGGDLSFPAVENGQLIPPKKEFTVYRFTCNHCGMTYERTRKSSFTENYKDYACGNCHSVGTLQKIE